MIDFERREHLVNEWHQPSFSQKLALPTDYEWQSKGGEESQLVMAWTGECFSNDWVFRITDRIRNRLGIHCRDKLWARHSDSLMETCCDFFNRWDPTTVLNAVTVTPSRVLFRHWAGGGPYALLQNQHPDFAFNNLGNAAVSLTGLGSNQRLPMYAWQWSGVAARPHTVFWNTYRSYRGKLFPEWRVFTANREMDTVALANGKLPELDAIVAAEGDGIRAPTPMIHFWRVNARGTVAMLVLELTREGKLVSIRWSQQPFDCFMLSHVWYFDALSEALGTRQRLWTP